MKKYYLLLLIIISTNNFAQVLFEKGYFINNSDQKTECFIKNEEWKKNPTTFEYKISENSQIQIGELQTIKEFVITNSAKYVRANVKIDKTTENVNELKFNKNPTFAEEQLFLKVLIEGKASLYGFENENLQKFFFSKDNSPIVQLVFIKYLVTVDEMASNDMYKQQLWTELKCSKIDLNTINKLEYRKMSLTNFVTTYNDCSNSKSSNFKSTEKKDLFNLTPKIQIRNGALNIDTPVSLNNNAKFGNKITIAFGVETEFILPYNKNQWAIFIEPTYQNYKSEVTNEFDNVSGRKLTAIADYTSIEVPVGLRKYFFKNNYKLFVNIAYVYDFKLKSSIIYNRIDGSEYVKLNVNSSSNFFFGFGAKLKDKYSFETRLQTSRNILGQYPNLDSNYYSAAIVLGYTIF